MYFSLILRPKSPPEHSSGITLLTAVSLAQTVKTLSDAPAQIKWPNDILIHGKKLAGILTEMSAAGMLSSTSSSVWESMWGIRKKTFPLRSATGPHRY